MVVGRRGQDAPIELVVAVIILLASMAIAIKLMSDVGESQCISKLKSEVDGLKLAMQDLSIQSPPSSKKVYFNMPSCGGTSVDVVRFVFFNKPQYCRNCPGHFDSCWQVQLASYDEQKGYSQSSKLAQAGACIDLTGAVNLIDESTEVGGKKPGCIALGATPCLPGETNCDAERAGVYSAWSSNPAQSPSNWRTFGKSYYYREQNTDDIIATAAGTTRLYEITLTKTVTTGGGGQGTAAEQGAILICAKPVVQQ